MPNATLHGSGRGVGAATARLATSRRWPVAVHDRGRADHAEAVGAFAAKRAPVFRGG